MYSTSGILDAAAMTARYTTNPNMAPPNARRTLSVSNCRITRHRDAPSESRTAISCRRLTDALITSPLTLVQTIAMTRVDRNAHAARMRGMSELTDVIPRSGTTSDSKTLMARGVRRRRWSHARHDARGDDVSRRRRALRRNAGPKKTDGLEARGVEIRDGIRCRQSEHRRAR